MDGLLYKYRQGSTFHIARWIATVIIIEDDMYTDDVTLGHQSVMTRNTNLGDV